MTTTKTRTPWRSEWTPRPSGAKRRAGSGNGTSSGAASPDASSRSPRPLLRGDVGARDPTIHQEGGRGDVRGVVARQEQGAPRDLVGLGEAPHRQVHEPACRLLGILGEEL